MAKKPFPKHKRQDKPTVQETGNGYWIFGKHAALAAINNPARVCTRLVVTQGTADSLPYLKRELSSEIVENQALNAMLPPGAVHQGIAVRVKPLENPDVDIILAGTAPVVILDQVTDPHNVGAILRSAAAFGAAAIIMPKDSSPEETGVLAKSASGALEIVPMMRVTNLARTMETLKKNNFWCLGFDGEATQTLHQLDAPAKVALVMGAEGKGLRPLTKQHCDIMVRLPISPKVESLNVSNAAAIALYHLAVVGK